MAADIYPEHDALVDAISLQTSASQLTRQSSRSSATYSGHRPTRIEKPRSNHNSPRTMERRKTTAGTKRYATLDDHFNMMFESTGTEETIIQNHQAPARPVSWHPSSAQFHVPSRLSVQGPNWAGHSPSRISTHGSDYYSLSPQSPMHLDPSQVISPYSQTRSTNQGSQSSESSVQPSRHSYAMSSYSTPSTEPWYLQEWARKAEAQTKPQGHGSSDFLPIQHPSTDQDGDSSMDDDEEETGKELVGMGLYDPPEVNLDWESSALQGRSGKGLKLEETWQPPEIDEDEDVDDASSDDGSVEELPTREEPRHLPLQTKPQLPPSMEGQSFFFEEDESYTKEWWFQQLKQPTVRATGLAYDWL